MSGTLHAYSSHTVGGFYYEAFDGSRYDSLGTIDVALMRVPDTFLG